MNETHQYLSPGCFHARHDKCVDQDGHQHRNRVSKCRWCDAKCSCACHQNRTPLVEAKSTPGSITVGPGEV